MSQVYRQLLQQSFPLRSFIQASALHVGAAAAAAALRRDLVEGQRRITSAEFDQAYAIARITPGTNLLAMYVLVGKRLGGWRGAALALLVGVLIPAAMAGSVAAFYVANTDEPFAVGAMQGARAGALAVLFWAVVRLLRPQLAAYRVRGTLLAIGTLIVLLVAPVPQIVVLLSGGVIGATFFRSAP